MSHFFMLDKALAMLSILLGYFSLVQLNNPNKIKIIRQILTIHVLFF
jgi:hypothetical protein